MSAASIWATAACVLGVLLSVALGAYHDLAQRYRGRGVTIAQQRETIRTLKYIAAERTATPIHDMLRARHDAMGRDLARVHDLDEYREGDWR